MVEFFFFPVRVRYDKAGNLWECRHATPSDMKFFEETNVRFFQAMYEFDGTKNRFTVLVDQADTYISVRLIRHNGMWLLEGERPRCENVIRCD